MSRLSERRHSLLLRVTPTPGSGPSGKPRPAWGPAASGPGHVIDIGLFAQPVAGEGTVHSEVASQAQGLPTAWLGVRALVTGWAGCPRASLWLTRLVPAGPAGGRPTSDFNPELGQDGVSRHFWLGHSCLSASPPIVFKERTVRSQSGAPSGGGVGAACGAAGVGAAE